MNRGLAMNLRNKKIQARVTRAPIVAQRDMEILH
jgi:hypothetical protein